jgi:sec-independent protein translocase protein TatB
MFDLDPGKLIVIGIVALIAIPSKDLPRVLRTLGQVSGRMRRMAAEFQGQFMDAMREAELHDLRKEVDAAKAAVADSVKLEGAFDPMAEVRKHIASAMEDETLSRQPAPHPEEASRLEPTKMSISGQPEIDGAVAKDDPEGVAPAASFETRHAAAPQDEGAGERFPQKAKE